MVGKARWFAVGLMVGVFAYGCSGDGSGLGPDGTPDNGDNGDNGAPQVTLADLSSEIFTGTCARSGCHGNSFPEQGMNLSADVIAANIIGVDSSEQPDLKRVDPGNPEGSYLLKKVRGDGDISDNQMPPGGALTAEQIEKIRAWIEAGAPTE